jgi:hypothetical protein
MSSYRHRNRTTNLSIVHAFAWIVLAGATMGRPVSAQTYISAEPIPSQDIVGTTNLAKILGIGYPNLELWSQRLLNDCHIVQNVINALSDNRAISTVFAGNTRFLVAAGGFEAVTDPTYVLTLENSGSDAATAADIFVLDNALGYALNEGGTAQFSLPFNKLNPFEFALDYAVVTFAGSLTGVQAKGFFDYLGTIDPALWSGTNAGFTQVNVSDSAVNNFMMDNSMLFLIGSVPKQEFIQGLFQAARTTPNATYSPLAANGKPATAKAGAAFPGNDWIAFPAGDGYLTNLGNPSPQLLQALGNLRQQHLQAVANLLRAIDKGNVSLYLNNQFKCQ